MLSAAIAYQVFRQENPQGIDKVKAMLDKHPWYANQWQARLQDVPAADRDLVLFMQAARWSDDLRNQDKGHNRPSWQYINLPFKSEGQPVNILTALAENGERGEKRDRSRAKRYCARVALPSCGRQVSYVSLSGNAKKAI